MPERVLNGLTRILRWSERYIKTDMVYLVKTAWWVNLNIVITSALGLLLSVAFANLLSPATYGLYQYLLALSALISAITLSGMNNAVIQSVARGYEGALRIGVKAQLQWASVPALISIGVALYYLVKGNSDIGIGLLCIAFLTPLVGAFSTYSAYLNGKKEFKNNFYFSTSINILYYISVFVGLLFLKNALVLLLINLGVNAVANIYAYWKILKIYKPNYDNDPQTVPYGKHLSIINAFGTILTQLDAVLVFHFLGPVELAVYSFASMLPERVGSFFNFLGAASLPKFANQSRLHIRRGILDKVIRIATLGLITSLVYALLAPFLFHLLFPRYLTAIPYTQVYALIIALLAILNVVNTALIAKQLKRELYVTNFVNPIILICLQIPFLLLWGIMGILIARLIADTFGILLALLFLFKPITPQSE